MVLPTELSYRGKKSIDYLTQGKPYSILPPLERRVLRDVSVDGSPYTVVRAYPTSIHIVGTQRDMFIIRRTRKHFFSKKCSKWDSNSCPADDAKYGGAEDPVRT